VAAPLSIKPVVGRVLHALTIAQRPLLIIEFGASLGYSTIYLASALRDVGTGLMITTELLPAKASSAAENLARAGLADLVEIRVGDALSTLVELDTEVDLLFLDGSNDLYLPVLNLLEPRLSRRAFVVADMSRDEPQHDRYRAYVHDLAHGYLSTEIPLDAGLVISARH
jgi:predicted O-methyltransferase YrrM